MLGIRFSFSSSCLRVSNLKNFSVYYDRDFIKLKETIIKLNAAVVVQLILVAFGIKCAFPLLNKTAGKTEYHVPAMVRVDLRKISEINLEKSSAEIAAMWGAPAATAVQPRQSSGASC